MRRRSWKCWRRRGLQKKKEDSESDTSEELTYADSDCSACEDITYDCGECKSSTAEVVRIRCLLCDRWWHAKCVTHIDLKDKSQQDLDAMDVQFFCCTDNIMQI